MSVNTNGCTVYAHKSMSMNEIAAIIQRSEDLISKFDFLSSGDSCYGIIFGLVRRRQYISQNERKGR